MGLSIVVPFAGTAWMTKSGKLSPAMVEVLPPEWPIKNGAGSELEPEAKLLQPASRLR